MTVKEKGAQFLVTFVATFVSAAVVTFLWNVLFHGERVVDWSLAVVLGVAVGASLTVTEAWNRKRHARA